MEDARNIDFHFQFLYWMKIKWTKTTRTESPPHDMIFLYSSYTENALLTLSSPVIKSSTHKDSSSNLAISGSLCLYFFKWCEMVAPRIEGDGRTPKTNR